MIVSVSYTDTVTTFSLSFDVLKIESSGIISWLIFLHMDSFVDKHTDVLKDVWRLAIVQMKMCFSSPRISPPPNQSYRGRERQVAWTWSPISAAPSSNPHTQSLQTGEESRNTQMGLTDWNLALCSCFVLSCWLCGLRGDTRLAQGPLGLQRSIHGCL